MQVRRKPRFLLLATLAMLAAGCATDPGYPAPYTAYPAYPGYGYPYGYYGPAWDPYYDASIWPDYGYFAACSPFCGAFYGYWGGYSGYYWGGHPYSGPGWRRPPWNGGWPGHGGPYPPPHRPGVPGGFGGPGGRITAVHGHSFSGHTRGR